MGYRTYSATEWDTYAAKTKTATHHSHIYKATRVDDALHPKNIEFRESRDSAAHPLSTPVQLWLDQTGSMGVLATQIAKKGLGTVFQEILNRKPITDPHVLVGALGDIRSDTSPCQATQFETAIPELTAQIEKLYLEGNGGGNSHESYDLPWWFAANYCRTDAWDKRRKKGYLFTIGDEYPPKSLPKALMKDKLGIDIQADLLAADSLEMAQRQWNIYHVVVEEGYHASRYKDTADQWRAILGENVLPLKDINALGEVIVAAIEVAEGRDADAVAASYSGGTSLAVAHAVRGLTRARSTGGTGIVRID